MNGYNSFSEFYDSLTQNVGYKERADYILEIFKRLDHNMGLSLDLACGTGSLTVELKKRGVDIFGADASPMMLSLASMKAHEQNLDILFLCQKMQNLELYGNIDTCVCTLDSINHLTDKRDVQKAFDKVAYYMNEGGYFLFDANTIYKHSEILADNVFVYETDDVFCVWQNSFLENDNVEINLDFFEKSGKLYKRESESFCERAYPEKELEEMLTNSGFELVCAYGDMSFENPREHEQRIVYIARKKA